MPMQTRRKFMLAVTTTCVALALTVGTALAAELLATVKSVDTDAKKITVTPKDGGDDVIVTIKEDTEWVSPKGEKIEKYDLTKLKKGRQVEITHENAVASKVILKKGAGKKKDAN
jgi:Cu/Ag efflux protein CusF